MREEIQSLLDIDPFNPFRIRLVNGDVHDVNNPDSVALLGRYLYLAPIDGEWVLFRYTHIASLESLLAM